jgi:ribosomal protein S21
MEIIVHNGNIEKAIVRLRRMVRNSGLVRDLKRSSFYLTRTERRKEKDRVAIKRTRKNQKRSGGAGWIG